MKKEQVAFKSPFILIRVNLEWSSPLTLIPYPLSFIPYRLSLIPFPLLHISYPFSLFLFHFPLYPFSYSLFPFPLSLVKYLLSLIPFILIPMDIQVELSVTEFLTQSVKFYFFELPTQLKRSKKCIYWILSWCDTWNWINVVFFSIVFICHKKVLMNETKLFSNNIYSKAQYKL